MASLSGSNVKGPTGQPVGLEHVAMLHTPLASSLERWAVPEMMTMNVGDPLAPAIPAGLIFGGLALAALDHEATTSGQALASTSNNNGCATNNGHTTITFFG